MAGNEVNFQEINKQETGIYIHIPFCRKKCLYCDFFSGGGRGVDWKRFTESLVSEFIQRREELKTVPSTLYIGGGTPSLMPLGALSYLVSKIKEISGKTDDWDEFTIEVNPEDVTEEACEVWKQCGVNRISMGVQSLNDKELKIIGRNHNSGGALKAVDILRKNFDNYTVDLIFGLPGQALASWKDTVNKVINIRPAHISAYSLMFEEGTALTALREQGRLSFPTEEECVEMWIYLRKELGKAGYHQYELSNYALPGRESIHNQRYWLGNPYLGLGPSAHSYDGQRTRRANPNDIRGYINYFGDGKRSGSSADGERYIEEILTDEELKEERIMLAMRMKKGLNLEDFRKDFGEKALQKLLSNSKKILGSGKLELVEGYIRLTDEGLMIADDIILEMSM